MVYRRRRTYRRKTYGRKRNYRRRFRRTYRTNRRGQKIYMFTRHLDYGELVVNAATGAAQGYNFSLSDLPNYTEFTNLYDQYKINAVKICFIPQQTMSNSLSTANSAQAYVRFFSAIDYDDTTVTGPDDLRQYQNCKYTPIYRRHKRFIYKPKIVDSSSYTLSPWISTTAPSANYFGLKVAVEPTDSTVLSSFTYTIEAKFYMSFKNVK